MWGVFTKGGCNPTALRRVDVFLGVGHANGCEGKVAWEREDEYSARSVNTAKVSVTMLHC